jgi:hypothetical protein
MVLKYLQRMNFLLVFVGICKIRGLRFGMRKYMKLFEMIFRLYIKPFNPLKRLSSNRLFNYLGKIKRKSVNS